MNKNRHTLSVTAVVECQGKFLFVKRHSTLGNFPDKWVFPGGKVEPGEDVIQALWRELKEETGLEFLDEIAFLSAYQFMRKEDGSSSQGLVFLVRTLEPKVKLDSASVLEFRWIEPEEILDYQDETIYGMEVHVRNAVVALKKHLLVDWRLLSVTTYQNRKCSITKEYLKDLHLADDVDEFLQQAGYLPNKKYQALPGPGRL